MSRRIIFAAVLAIYGTTARADWQWTRWGMTEDQLKEAAEKAGVPLLPVTEEMFRRYGHLYTALYRTSKYEFTSRFTFTTTGKQLRLVSLYPLDDGECLNLLNDLVEQYGETKPGNDDALGTREWSWVDFPKGNRVKYTELPPFLSSSCLVQYFPLGHKFDKPEGL